eukprot:5132792-Pleurochrysis_carterae.AAC.1
MPHLHARHGRSLWKWRGVDSLREARVCMTLLAVLGCWHGKNECSAFQDALAALRDDVVVI